MRPSDRRCSSLLSFATALRSPRGRVEQTISLLSSLSSSLSTLVVVSTQTYSLSLRRSRYATVIGAPFSVLRRTTPTLWSSVLRVPGRARLYGHLADQPVAERSDRGATRSRVQSGGEARAGQDLPSRGEQPRVYLCHGFCELGAVEALGAFREIARFLGQHPDEVLIIEIEDYVTPKDMIAVIEESGLAKYVYRGPAGPPWPTITEMIVRGRGSDHRRAFQRRAPWYHRTDRLSSDAVRTRRSHSMVATRRRFNPNLQKVRIQEPAARPRASTSARGA